MEGGENRLSEQPIELVFDNSITLACSTFQLLAVQDLYAPSDITDCAYVLKVTRSHRNAFAAYAQHIRDQFLSHDQLIRIHTVVA